MYPNRGFILESNHVKMPWLGASSLFHILRGFYSAVQKQNLICVCRAQNDLSLNAGDSEDC